MKSNTVGPSTIQSKLKGKQLAIGSEESDVESSLGLKKILIEPEGIYQHNALDKGIEVNDEHSAIAESQSSNSYMEKEAFIHMVNTPEELARVKKSSLICSKPSNGLSITLRICLLS